MTHLGTAALKLLELQHRLHLIGWGEMKVGKGVGGGGRGEEKIKELEGVGKKKGLKVNKSCCWH